MLWSVRAEPYTIRGCSLGGIHTALQVPELDILLDIGITLRSFAATDDLFLSHGHADHVGALNALLGLRGLFNRGPLRIFLPREIQPIVEVAVTELSRLQRHPFTVELVPVDPGSELEVRRDLDVRVFRTHHPVPSVGYQFLRKVQKLKPEFIGLPGPEIARRRAQGDALFDSVERLELAYATDTLLRVIDTAPYILKSRVLILECSFLDERKALADSRAGCHIHLDELLERADAFENEHLVLMHFSQLYEPEEVRAILRRRCPPSLFERIVVFAPGSGTWPG
jgi:ribonuclease Z